MTTKEKMIEKLIEELFGELQGKFEEMETVIMIQELQIKLLESIIADLLERGDSNE